MVVAYKHEPFTDFSVEANKLAFEEGLKESRILSWTRLSINYWGRKITTEDKIVSVNPANKEELVGRVSKASRELAEKSNASSG